MMVIKHPFFDGLLSTRLVAIGKSQKIFADLIKHAPEHYFESHLPDMQTFIHEQIGLYESANQAILHSFPEMVSDEYFEIQMEEQIKKSDGEEVKKIRGPGA